MSNNLVIVAIPDENDRVWKISSEKIPHLTILHLGDSEQVSNLESIMQFVEHAASTSLTKFYLPVERRGELGNDKADVLFFRRSRYDFKAVREFRSLLLKDSNIKSAYDATSQFELPAEVGAPGQAWIPHLTLGYPESPAKSIPDDQMTTFYDVSFDKIAIWPGDFEGPDYQLKDYWEEFDEMEIPMDVAMSDIQHHGVKGMRWGVRKTETAGGGGGGGNAEGAATTVKKGAKGAAKIADNVVFSLGTQNKYVQQAIANEAHATLKKKDLPEIKAKHGEYGKMTKRATKPFSSEARAYRKDVKKAYINQLEASANRRTNFQKNLRYTIKEKGEVNTKAHFWRLQVEHVPSAGGSVGSPGSGTSQFGRRAKHDALEHAEAAQSVLDVRPIFEDGYIVDFEIMDDAESMAQTADLGSDFLAHHGVKGMRWGVRKSEDAGGGSGAGGKKLDAVKKGVKEIAKFGGDVSFENQAMDGRARDRILNHANETFHKSTLPAIKAKPEHQKASKLKNRLRHPFSPEAKAYRKDVKESYIKQLEQSANAMTNSSQNRQFTIRERGIELPSQGGDLPRSKTYWEVSTRPIKHDGLEHADEQFATLEVLTDDDGWITELKKVDPETVLAQTMDLGATLVASLIEDGDQLEHYGTKGMHWGVRNNAPTGIRRNRMEPRMAPAPTDVRAISRVPPGKRRKTKIVTDGGENHPASDDAIKVAVNRTKLHKSGPAALSNKELQEVANRIELEARVKRATQPGAQKFISNLLRNQGNQQANQFVQEQFKRRRTSGAPA